MFSTHGLTNFSDERIALNLPVDMLHTGVRVLMSYESVCVVGYVCVEYSNPPDLFLDIINGDSTAIQSQQSL